MCGVYSRVTGDCVVCVAGVMGTCERWGDYVAGGCG